jgi:hypothetical protein
MRVIVPQIRRDAVRDAFGVGQHIVVPETKHAVAVRFQHCAAWRIRLFAVLPAIDFDDQLGAMAREIGDILTDRNLPPKAGIGKTSRSNRQSARSASVALARNSRERVVLPSGGIRFMSAVSSGEATPTQPSPIKGEGFDRCLASPEPA